jgi:hypothetical protein
MTDRRARLVAGPPEVVEEILGVLDEVTIRVVLSEELPWRRQLLVLALVDLLGRLFPRIDVVGAAEREADTLLPPGPPLLGARIAEARTHGTALEDPGAVAAVTVVVGDHDTVPADIAGEVLCCDGDGWQAYLGPDPSALTGEGDHHNPIGPLVAACRAAARAFAVAAGAHGPTVPELTPTYWSGLTYDTGSSPLMSVELPAPGPLAAVLAGAGSVGGAATYAFARVPGLSGELFVVDEQDYADNNPDRALLATNVVVAAHDPKAEHVRAVLAHLVDLRVDPFRGTIQNWVGLRPLGPLPLVLCSFDSVASRRSLQDCLPLEVINAACGGDDVAVSGHLTNDGPCVYCLHVPGVLDTDRITFNLIVASTGLPPRLIQAWLEQRVTLGPTELRRIESLQGMPAGQLDGYVGCTLEELHRLALAYGEFTAELHGGVAAVAAPWVTALAGFILAGEALKASTSAYKPYRLGPWSPRRNRYEETAYGSASNAIVGPVARWKGSECLCRSPRRLRLLSEIYDPA